MSTGWQTTTSLPTSLSAPKTGPPLTTKENNVTFEQSNQSVDPDQVSAVASALHEDWRRTRLQADGGYEPRVKATTDEAWIAAHGTNQVDIANTAYPELPDDWQAENRAAAGVVVELLGRGAIDLSVADQRAEAGSVIHQAWLERNPWARGGELDVPFDQLPSGEQAKDLAQVVIAQEVLLEQ
jgi:hypothetical protein